MIPCANQTGGPRRGFTLVEVLLSLALLSSLLLALNFFVFSMGELWGQNREQRLFGEHVRAVSRYVENLMRRAARPPASAAIRAGSVRPPAGPAQELLTFELPEGDRLLVWPDHPLPEVQCALDAQPGQGLLLYWHSHLELRFAEEPPRVTVVSPFVTGLDYDYYDAAFHSWRNWPVLQRDAQGHWLTPTRLHLHFRYGGYHADTVLNVPAVTPGLPPY